MRPWMFLLAALAAPPVWADTLIATRTIRANTIIAPDDLAYGEVETPGALSRPEDAIGLESRVVLYAGRPIRPGDLGPPTMVERNAIVTLIYRSGGLTISAEGRAMGRAGAGDDLRVLNLMSRVTVTGRVQTDGTVLVASSAGS